MTTELWIGISILVLAALVILWWPFAKKNQLAANSQNARSEANTQSYRISLDKLDTQLDEGRIESQEYDELKAELGRKLLQDESSQEQALQIKSHPIALPIFLSLFVASLSIYIYLSIGSSSQLEESATRHAQMQSQQQKFQQALAMLEQKVQQNPNNSEMLFNLAHFYISAQQFDNAVTAFQKLITIEGEHAEFIGPQAQALYYKNEQKMTPAVKALTERALALDADDVSTLVLLGMDNFVNGDYAKAIVLWQRVLNNGRPGTDVQAITNAVASAKERLAMTGQTMPEIPAATVSNVGVSVDVSISDALKDQFSSEQTIFIYAIALEGSRMPLAAVKLTASQLPISIRLDDSRAMTPNAKISQHSNVRLFAVISKTGSPGIKPGDLHGMIENAALNADKPYTLIIDKVAE
jgi:cytochrome c-type biogenesis protein CcmH